MAPNLATKVLLDTDVPPDCKEFLLRPQNPPVGPPASHKPEILVWPDYFFYLIYILNIMFVLAKDLRDLSDPKDIQLKGDLCSLKIW